MTTDADLRAEALTFGPAPDPHIVAALAAATDATRAREREKRLRRLRGLSPPNLQPALAYVDVPERRAMWTAHWVVDELARWNHATAAINHDAARLADELEPPDPFAVAEWEPELELDGVLVAYESRWTPNVAAGRKRAA